MLPTRSLWTPPTSGFVPFSPGGHPDDDVDVVQAPVVARQPVVEDAAWPATPTTAPSERAWRQAATWQPGTTLGVRRVEMAVLAAICGYFGVGLVKLLGLL